MSLSGNPARVYHPARVLVEVLTARDGFVTDADYREAVLEGLCELARSFGIEPPDDVPRALGIAS